MVLYRIYTEDKNRDGIERCVADAFDGFTILVGTGYWRGVSEAALIIEVLGSETDRETILRIATWIRRQNKQDSVAVTEQVVGTYSIGEQI